MRGDVVLITSGAIWLEDDPAELVARHRESGNDLTVFGRKLTSHRASHAPVSLRPAGLYCCNRKALEHIPAKGFFDIKEQLIPQLLRSGMSVGAIALRRCTFEITTWTAYLQALRSSLTGHYLDDSGYKSVAPGIWYGDDVQISPKARIVGPAFLDHGCRLDDGAVVMGPSLLGPNSVVARDTWLVRVAAPAGLAMPPDTMIADGLLCSGGSRSLSNAAHAVRSPETTSRQHATGEANRPNRHAARISGRTAPFLATLSKVVLAGAAIASVLALVFPHTVADLWAVWTTNPDYGAGLFVPVACIYMIASRLRSCSNLHSSLDWLGIPVCAAGLTVHLVGAHYLFPSLEFFAMVVCLQGAALALLGRQTFRALWFPFMFLFLMLPLPNPLHEQIMPPLQFVTANMSAGVLELLGYPADWLGNTLRLGGQHVEVANACNGLRLTLACLVVSGVIVHWCALPRRRKLLVMLSVIPIALLCNVLHIVITAMFVVHDLGGLMVGQLHLAAGLMMMPVALAVVILEIQLLSRYAPVAPEIDVSGASARTPYQDFGSDGPRSAMA